MEDFAYPIPNKEYLMTKINNARWFSKFDLKSGFWQMAIQEQDRHKTAFVVPNGFFEWNVMPMGLKTAPSEFQQMMDRIFGPHHTFILVYIDDILIYSHTLEEHLRDLKKFLEIIKPTGLIFSESKTILCQQKIDFLGVEINKGKITLQEHVLQSLKNFPDKLSNKKQRFLGCLNYMASFYTNLKK